MTSKEGANPSLLAMMSSHTCRMKQHPRLRKGVELTFPHPTTIMQPSHSHPTTHSLDPSYSWGTVIIQLAHSHHVAVESWSCLSSITTPSSERHPFRHLSVMVADNPGIPLTNPARVFYDSHEHIGSRVHLKAVVMQWRVHLKAVVMQ